MGENTPLSLRKIQMLYHRLLSLIIFFTILSAAHADEPRRYHQVGLTATADREIVPDLMRITLFSELRDKNPARLAEATTKILNAAIEKARLVEGITIKSGNRNSYRVADKKILIWQERAELHLESRDFAVLATLSAALMDDLKIAGQYFLVSKRYQKEIENFLIEEAIAAFGERAKIATKSLGGQSYKIVQLNLDGQGGVRPFIAARNMEMMMDSSQSADLIPQIEAGTREIAIIAQGIIEIEM